MRCSLCPGKISFGDEFFEVVYFTGAKEILSDGRIRLESYVYSNLCSECADKLVDKLTDAGYEVICRSYSLENHSNY